MCAIYFNKQTKGMTAKILELTEIYANKLIVLDHLMKYLTKIISRLKILFALHQMGPAIKWVAKTGELTALKT